jgi:TfoX/Sxy family transcriptional regulator of competence genes
MPPDYIKLQWVIGSALLKIPHMAYNEKLADRVREIIAETHKDVEEKRMFGGLCFMVNNKMCVGVEQKRLMIRLDPSRYEEVLEKEGVKPMDFTGKVMKGYIFVDIDALNTRARWLIG